MSSTKHHPQLYIMAVGMALTERRLELKISQLDLADSSGLDRSYISRIEAPGCNVSLTTLTKLLDKLDITHEQLFLKAERILKEMGRKSNSKEQTGAET